MSLPSLAQIAHPPTKPSETGSPKTWKKIEQQLGISLPDDYKNLIDHYGTGAFNDFIRPYNPFASKEDQNLFQMLEILHQADSKTQKMADPAWTVVRPFELYPAIKGLLPWGNAGDLGLALFWQIGNQPQNWPTIFYDLSTGEYETWKMPMTDFLFRIFTDQIESVFFPKNLMQAENSIWFSPY